MDYESNRARIIKLINEAKNRALMDETFNLRRCQAACEMMVRDAEFELEYSKEHLKRLPSENSKLAELKLKKLEIEIEIRKEELADVLKKLDEKLAKNAQ